MAIKVSRILHAGYVFECGDAKIAFDPIFENPFSRNCYAYPEVRFDLEAIRRERFDAVFISHYHDDHCSFESLNFLDRGTPIYMFCVFEEMFELLRELGFSNVRSLALNQAVAVGEFRVTPRRALDADVDSIFQIEGAGLKILNVVDSWIDDETMSLLKSQGPWDLVLWPFQTMREIEVLAPTRFAPSDRLIPHEWVPQIKALRPRNLVASSCQFRHEAWSWYNQALFPISYRGFREQIVGLLPEMQVLRIDPGESIFLKSSALEMASGLSWVERSSDAVVDYEYDPNLKPMTTAEIAKRFARVSETQKSRVVNYCRNEMLERIQNLGFAEDGYFAKAPRIWYLSVYDHEGASTDFWYRTEEENEAAKIELIEPSVETRASWRTEIPMAKLSAALDEGESLTSMYVRINDFELRGEIDEADVLEDPLVRSLYDGVFASYQKAQLSRILSRKI